ncbi:MEDS domain-containing protein [Clostridiaceae bacterium 35-E11]
MKNVNSMKAFKKLSYGDHGCLIYSDLDEYREIAIDYMIEGLLNNEMVVCVIDAYPRRLLIQDLQGNGIDVAHFVEIGQLCISNIKEIYHGNEGFSPDDTIE